MCYVRTVTHREMRNNSAEILRAVEAGEIVQITNHGRVVAVMSPARGSVVERLIAYGKVRRAIKPVTHLAQIEPRPSSVPSAEILADVRRPR